MMTAFFVVDSGASYNALLGRDWIHTNWCIPSTLHQFLIFWNGNEVEVVLADHKPFVAKVNCSEAVLYEDDIGPVKFVGRDKNGKPKAATMIKQHRNQLIQAYKQIDRPSVVITPIDDDETSTLDGSEPIITEA